MIKDKLKPNIFEFLRFAFVGVIATAINLATYYIMLSFNINPSISYTLGYIVSLVFNYILTLKFTFKTSHSNSKGFKFLLTHLFNYTLQMTVLNLLLLLVSKNIAPIITQAISVPINFLLVRKVVK